MQETCLNKKRRTQKTWGVEVVHKTQGSVPFICGTGPTKETYVYNNTRTQETWVWMWCERLKAALSLSISACHAWQCQIR